MSEAVAEQGPILVVGNSRLAFSITVCLLQASFPVTLCTQNEPSALEWINTYLADLKETGMVIPRREYLNLSTGLSAEQDYAVAIVITDENLPQKKTLIRQLEQVLPYQTIIAVNTESLPLSSLQQEAVYPERIIGANWVEPAHTTYFLEIIANATTSPNAVDIFHDLAQKHWQKDPYVLRQNFGIRSRIMAAMAREAFYLIENGYVGVEDIDRACRSDAGYYLPFAGNFRYMDLMGTYIYGLVMQDLNPELAKDRLLPEFFKELMAQGAKGMENNQGFYQYQPGEAERWEERFRQFSYQIKEIIQKYPFNYRSEINTIQNKAYI